MALDPYAHRRGLTFGQTEGTEDLPRQLELREISKELRAKLHLALVSSLVRAKENIEYAPDTVGGSWGAVLLDLHVNYRHGYIDDYSSRWDVRLADLGETIKNRSYAEIFGTVQFILQHPRCPGGLAKAVASVLEETRAAYRVVSGGLIVPISSEREADAIEQALTDLRSTTLEGARKHLEAAASALTQGSWADSVRESIQAVEAVARMLEPSGTTLGPALEKLSNAGHIHPALKAGLSKLYGYTSDEPGIRHPLLEHGDAKVDETDALFMIGACSSFVSYLIGRHGLLTCSKSRPTATSITLPRVKHQSLHHPPTRRPALDQLKRQLRRLARSPRQGAGLPRKPQSSRQGSPKRRAA